MVTLCRIHIAALGTVIAVGLALGGTVASADPGGGGSARRVNGVLVAQAARLADQFFRVEWKVVGAPNGQSKITGYVYNDYGDAAQNVEIRVSGLDANGHEIQSVIRPVRGLVPAEGRAYFDVRVPTSRAYSIAVAAFDFVEAGPQA